MFKIPQNILFLLNRLLENGHKAYDGNTFRKAFVRFLYLQVLHCYNVTLLQEHTTSNVCNNVTT